MGSSMARRLRRCSELPSWREFTRAQASPRPSVRIASGERLAQEAVRLGTRHVAAVALDHLLLELVEHGSLRGVTRALDEYLHDIDSRWRSLSLGIVLRLPGSERIVLERLGERPQCLPPSDLLARFERSVADIEDRVDTSPEKALSVLYEFLLTPGSLQLARRLNALRHPAPRVERAMFRYLLLEGAVDTDSPSPVVAAATRAAGRAGPRALSTADVDRFRAAAHHALVCAAASADAAALEAADRLLAAQDIDERRLIRVLKSARSVSQIEQRLMREVGARTVWRDRLRRAGVPPPPGV